MEPAPELVAGVRVTGDWAKVKFVFGNQVTVWGALVIVNVTETEVTE